MILIGQYDSPFVRRVGIALTLYGLEFEHWPWSTFGDADKLREYNPLTRVPTLVLDGGEVLIETSAIVDYIDGLVSAERRLFPVKEPARYRAMRVVGLASGLSDLAVRLFYEQVLHKQPSDVLVERLLTQIRAGLAVLERECADLTSTYWFGENLGYPDIAVAACLRHIKEAHPGLADGSDYPTLNAFSEQLEKLPVFKKISQVFIPPA
ncbi:MULTISPECIES: glutathione S-transferase family protein [Mesorhizobium]|uniref:Glutathione S-transferase family protein n=1 Tax=Mesorhizobium denitrificans TaxID=2294114 RepID=A0A371XCL4_9HYPH|nr:MULTISPECIES: glutathione S-transferase family protein [Mesorhizobium]RFC66961.1 glutathione S-transferase family protein [Mesorhizobium denitrificans]